MTIKLDRRDRRILYELDKNARQPLSNIAKKVNLSRESVLYRLNKYLEGGIIRNYLAIINMSKIGFTHYKIYLKLHNMTEKQEQAFIDYLQGNSFISWIASCDGAYSLILGIKARSIIELNSILKSIGNRYNNFIREQEITTIISAQHFYRNYLIEKKETSEREIVWGGLAEEINLDKINIVILDELAKNPRVNSVEIASKLKISPDSVIQRIKKMEKANIIEGYMLWPNVNKLKGAYYKVLVTFHNLDEEKEKQLKNYCLQRPNIVYIVNSLGKWQFEMDIETEGIEEFRIIMRDFLNNFSDIVSDYGVLNIYEEHKFIFFEKEIFNE